MKTVFRFSALLLLFISGSSFAQGTAEDYRRAETADTSYLNKVYHLPVAWGWFENENKLWYSSRIKGGREFILVDPVKKTKARAFDHDRLAKVLSQKLNRSVKALDLPFERISFKGSELEFVTDSVRYLCNLSSYECKVKERLRSSPPRYFASRQEEKNGKPVISPDSTWTAYIRNANVYIRNRKTKQEVRLSYDGSEGEYYSALIQWSPDSKKLMAYKVRPGESHIIYFVESSPVGQIQPKLQSREYPKPGDALATRMPQLFLVETKQHIKIPIEEFRNQFNLTNIEWRKDSRAFTFEFNERGHQRYKILEVTAPDGMLNTLVDEKSSTFIDYSPNKIFRQDINDGKEIIWMSERDGWNHLYLYDDKGNVKNQITKGEWPVRSIEYVDLKNRQIFFSASGLDAGIDPYLRGYYRVNFDGTGFTRLTPAGTEHVAAFSNDKKYFFDIASTLTQPQVTKIYSGIDGKEVMHLENADPAALYALGWKAPEIFSAKGRDGKTDIWGYILKPSNFDPSKKYPVIEYIYSGPQGNHVLKTFNPSYRTWHQLAELGFIVVQMDGMGTSNRSRAFHDVCWKNLKDGGFPDRILWIKEAAKTRSYMDISRVGIFGNSAGGQTSLGALLFHSDFYKVAVSSSGCHDNRMDKIWWNELFMGYPVGPHYEESSNVVNAYRLQGRLLLILGELDDNVDPASTMQVVNALIKAKKNFDFLMVPGMGHSLGGEYGERKRRDFFVKNLLGVDPPSW